jgi:hypothetical protein
VALLDPSNFSLDPQGMQSFQQRIADLRSTLPPSVAAAQPPISGIPSTTAQQQQQSAVQSPAIAGMRNQLNAVAGMQPPTPAPSAQQPTPPGEPSPQQLVMQNLQQFAQQVHPKQIEVLMKQLQDLNPPKLIGGDPLAFGRGGIFGTGVEPLDVLAFALGVGATWNLPQDKAQAMTWQIAGMPRAYKESQREAAKGFLSSAAQAMNTSIGMSNATTAQINSIRAQQQYDSGLQLADAYRKAGRHADALALEADKVNEHIALTGKTPDRLPTNLRDVISGISIGGYDPMEFPELLPRMGVDPNSPTARQEAVAKARALRQVYLSDQPPIVLPSGGAAGRTVEGPRGIEAVPGSAAIQAQMERELAAARSGQPVQPQLPAPGGAVAPQQPGAGITIPGTVAPVVPGAIAGQPAGAPGVPPGISPRLWSEVPPDQQQSVNQLFLKPIPEEQRKQMIGQITTRKYADELEDSYNRMAKAYNGKPPLGAQWTLYLAHIKSEIGDDAWTATKIGGEALQSLAQRLNIKPEAIEFGAKLSQAQRFARGALQDTGNLANKERELFRDMIGSLTTAPAYFRARIREFQRGVAQSYNVALQQNGLYKTEGFSPMDIPPLVSEERKAKPGAAVPPAAIQPPRGAVVPPPGSPGSPWQFIQPGPARPGSEY